MKIYLKLILNLELILQRETKCTLNFFLFCNYLNNYLINNFLTKYTLTGYTQIKKFISNNKKVNVS